MKLSNYAWIILTIVLVITTFPLKSILVLFTSILFAIIGCLTALYLNYVEIESDYDVFKSSGCLQMIESNAFTPQLVPNLNHNDLIDTFIMDGVLTGDAVIDEQLSDVLRLAFRDYIHSWYAFVSPNQQFPNQLYSIAQMLVKSITQRVQCMDIVSYMTTKLVDDFASHLRLFRLAQSKLKELKVNDPNANLLSIFFDFEVQMEQNICRDLVSEDNESCNNYLSHVCDILQHLLLPVECVKNRPLRLLTRGIFVKSCLFPLLELLSDPDFINQTLVWLCKSYVVSSDTFLTVLRCCDKSEELEAVREIVNYEIAVLRSKDTGGTDDFEIKQQLSSLLYVKEFIETRLKCLNEGSFDSDSNGIPTQIDWKKVKLISLPFDVVLKNNIGLSYFIEFMNSIGAQGYIYFYLNVEGFKISAEQQISEAQLSKLGKSDGNNSVDLESLKEAAINIYDTYLSEKASHKLKLDDIICKKIHSRILTEKLSENWFDEAHSKVFDIMMNNDNYFATFKKSNHYIKLLAELDLLKELNGRQEEDCDLFSPVSKSDDNSSITFDDTDSLNSLEDINDMTITPDTVSITSDGSIGSSSSSSGIVIPNNAVLNSNEDPNASDIIVEIIKTGVVREFGNAYAAYVLSVVRKVNSYHEEKWIVLRRYSDFFHFHNTILDKYSDLKTISLPGKRAFNNMSKDFLEQRKHLLNTYLNQLLKKSAKRKDLRDHMLKFLQPGNYEKEKFQFAKSMQNSIFNPLKSSVLNVGNVVKSGSENLFDGLQRLNLFGTISTQSNQTSFLPQKNNLKFMSTESLNNNKKVSSMISPNESSKVAASLDIESEDNIPLRIMLLLMDEVFDFKSKDLWLRRRIVTFLRQIIQATYGDTINRKIIDYVEDLTSASAIAEYIKSFKNSFWPNGHVAQPQPQRSNNVKMRTRIAAKILLLSSISDDLKRVIGSETARKGLLCVFEMFQHENLNRRLILVLFEGILQELFPDNYFKQIFQKLHSKSSRIADKHKKTVKWPPHLYQFLGINKSTIKSPTKSSLYKRNKKIF